MSDNLEPIEDAIEFGDAFFVPSHLAKAFFGTAVALVAGGISVGAAAYALHQFKRVTAEEVQAFIRGGEEAI